MAKKPQPAWTDDAANSLLKIIRKAMRSENPRKVEQAGRVVGKATKQATKQGNKSGRKIMAQGYKGEVKFAKDQKMASAEIERRARNEAIVKRQGRTVNAAQLGEAAGRKGSKLKAGKEVAMSAEKAEAARVQGRRATAQRAKGNAARKAEQIKLDNQIKNAKSATEKRALRQKLRAHEDKHGRFAR
jgi:hypothetical protein